MLISELIKHTPEDHADLENLKQALSALQAVALEINEAVREAERQARLNKIARKFLDAREKTVRSFFSWETDFFPLNLREEKGKWNIMEMQNPEFFGVFQRFPEFFGVFQSWYMEC